MFEWQEVNVGQYCFKLKVVGDFESFCLNSLDEYWPVYSQVWPSGLELAKFLMKEDLSGLKVLELGCGLSLPSMVVERRGGQVIASDNHPDLKDHIEEQWVANELKNIRFISLNWREFKVLGKFDLIIASDVLYDPELFFQLAEVVSGNLARNGKFWLADPGRFKASSFFHELDGIGIKPLSTKVSNDIKLTICGWS